MATAGTAYVNVRGDFSALNRGIDRTASGAKSRFKAIGKAAAIGLGAGLAGAAVAGKSFLDAQIESEKSQARMRTQLKASGKSYKKHAGRIEDVIGAQSRLSGLDDEDLQDSFTNIVRVTGDVNKSLKLNATAADFARAKNIDVAKAGEIVGKVAGGNTGILSRYGIVLKDGATASEALAALQQKFAGQAKGYGDTTAGAVDRMGVAWENIKETLGRAIAPAFERVADGAGRVIGEIDKIARRKDIDVAEKIRLSAEVLRDRLRPIVRELGNAIERAWPGMQDKIGTLARKAAGAFIRAWLASDWWMKIFVGLYLAKKLGVFSSLGKSAGGRFGRSFAKWGTPLIIGAIASALLDKQIQQAARGLADMITGKPPKGFRTPEESAATMKRLRERWGRELEDESSPDGKPSIRMPAPSRKRKKPRRRPRRPQPPRRPSRPATGGPGARIASSSGWSGMSLTQNIYEADDPHAVAVQSRRQIESAQRRYSNVNSPRN